MMSEPKPFASLSSGLLARKGQARPAMRPQGFNGGYASLSTGLDDLGWNDMGHADEPIADIHQLHADDFGDDQTIAPPPEGVPPVLAQRHQLKQEFEPPVLDQEEVVGAVEVPVFEPRPVSVQAATRIAKATAHKTKAAFTLRLDEGRHLRLRLASAVTGRSSQQLVTEALDAFLESLPEVDDLARQIPARSKG